MFRLTAFPVLVVIAFAAAPIAAQVDGLPPAPAPKCAPATQPYCGIARQLADLEARIARMRTTMDRCARGETHCLRGQMTILMMDLQDRLNATAKAMSDLPDAL